MHHFCSSLFDDSFKAPRERQRTPVPVPKDTEARSLHEKCPMFRAQIASIKLPIDKSSASYEPPTLGFSVTASAFSITLRYLIYVRMILAYSKGLGEESATFSSPSLLLMT